ncbi:MAG: YkgJ family cysteine cluster protein [Gammaproteobacteria bacterium]|nr:YkgJ family cysteine cluster protein [Gammaproteobacteria bacterium]
MPDSADQYAGDKQKHPWLSMLLDAYQTLDNGVASAIAREEKLGRKLACHKGCAACCRTHKDIPVYPLELVGITWFVTKKVTGTIRSTLKQQLREYKEGNACPFLVDNACSIHFMRPFACRQFNVFGKVCAEGEDAYHTRRRDVLVPIKKYTDAAFDKTLPFYGVMNKMERKKIIKKGSIHQTVRILQSCNWQSLAQKMQEYEQYQELINAHLKHE